MDQRKGLIVGLLALLLSGCQQSPERFVVPVSPLQLVLNDLGDSFQESVSNFSIQQRTLGASLESPDSVILVVDEDTPLDDSIAAQRVTYKLSYQQQQWRIIDKHTQQGCVSGRGSQQFSDDLCR
ncbi:hypothetical protein [Rosenbergiella nectarea]|uniref:hypothetical protein n=1 Tax=Rosenbergiella nectarea TaxID=988801 RepID=UPI001F4D6424|nr:hypothetical protein [Rosenbergiella nectarea]